MMAATAIIHLAFLYLMTKPVVVRGLRSTTSLRFHPISRVRIIASSTSLLSPRSLWVAVAAAAGDKRRMTTTTTMSNTAAAAATAATVSSLSDNGNPSQYPLESWRRLLEKSSESTRSIRGSNYVQLATVDPNVNEPRVRSIVFRGFLQLVTDQQRQHPLYSICDNLSCVFQMCTNEQSEKVHQVKQNPAAELLWWFPTTNEQYRIRGKIIFVGNGQFPLDQDATLKEARYNQWIRLTDAARDSFLCQELPYDSCSINDNNQKTNNAPGGKDASTGEIVPPPDNFLLMLLLPKHVDYLKLGDVNYRQVDERNEKEGTWSSQRVNP